MCVTTEGKMSDSEGGAFSRRCYSLSSFVNPGFGKFSVVKIRMKLSGISLHRSKHYELSHAFLYVDFRLTFFSCFRKFLKNMCGIYLFRRYDFLF